MNFPSGGAPGERDLKKNSSGLQDPSRVDTLLCRSVSARRRRPVSLIIIASAAAVAACAGVEMAPPTPDGPRISRLTLTPDGATAGCPAQIGFRIDTGQVEPARAIAGWVLTRGARIMDRGYLVFPLKREQIVGDAAVMTMVPERFGRYWYSIQLEDSAGRESNVLEGSFLVYAAPTGTLPTCP
jgi:hypothetical protein